MELWRASGRSAAKIGAELGIRTALLYRWARLEREPGSPPSAYKPKRSVEKLEAEIRRLRAENTKPLEQREVLKAKQLAKCWEWCNWVIDYVTRRFNASLAEAEKLQTGRTYAETPLSAISRSSPEPLKAT